MDINDFEKFFKKFLDKEMISHLIFVIIAVFGLTWVVYNATLGKSSEKKIEVAQEHNKLYEAKIKSLENELNEIRRKMKEEQVNINDVGKVVGIIAGSTTNFYKSQEQPIPLKIEVEDTNKDNIINTNFFIETLEETVYYPPRKYDLKEAYDSSKIYDAIYTFLFSVYQIYGFDKIQAVAQFEGGSDICKYCNNVCTYEGEYGNHLEIPNVLSDFSRVPGTPIIEH